MAGIRIFEFNDIGSGNAPVRRAPFTVAQANATIDGSSRQSSAFAAATRFVAVQADSDCHVVFGVNPTATTGGFKVAAGSTEDFAVNGGDKVAWIAA
jgi:hypothetical protein